MKSIRTFALAGIVVFAACAPDATGPGIDPVVPDTLTVLGHGAVTSRYSAEVAVRGEWAYTTTWGNRGAPGNAVFVWNVAGDTPVLVDSVIIPGVSTTGDVQISDDGALLVVATEFAGSMVIFDRTDPARPDSIATFTSANTANGVHTVKLGRVNGRHYAFLSINPSPSRLVIVDITDPAAPQEVFTQEMGSPRVHDVFVRDGFLFTALWNAGVTIWDIGGGGTGGTPENPVVIRNFIPVSGSIHNIWWFHDPATGAKRYLFLGEEGPGSVSNTSASGDIHVVDISTMSQPHQAAIYTLPGAGTHNFWMDENRGILYAAYYNGGVRAIDVRGNLGDCTEDQRSLKGPCDLRLMGREIGVGLYPGKFIWGVVYQADYVYASDMLSGIYKLQGF